MDEVTYKVERQTKTYVTKYISMSSPGRPMDNAECHVSNLDMIVFEHSDTRKTFFLQPKLVGLPVFGGIDLETGWIPVDSFLGGLLAQLVFNVWDKVGAATLTPWENLQGLLWRTSR
jgi:hypothetical protein